MANSTEGPSKTKVILSRKRHLINTDPQRRCYDGCHYSSALVWGPWEAIDWTISEKAEQRLKFWRELNDYAVSQRGRGAIAEFKTEDEAA